MKVLSLTILLAVLGTLAGGIMLHGAAVTRLFERDREAFREKEALRDALATIVRRFDALLDLDADSEDHPLFERLRGEYADYRLTITDVSSGLNLNFLPASDVAQKALAAFLFRTGNAASFLAFREANGLVTDTAEWEPFVNDEAKKAVTVYGWLPKVHLESEAGKTLLARFVSPDAEGLYPLVNDMALINVNTADAAIIKPLLSRESWRIPAAKVETLIEKIGGGALTEGELRAILGLPHDHEVYRYLGVRTTFWGIHLEKGRYRMEAVVAAIPEKESNTVKTYRLIEGVIGRNNG